MWRTVFAEEGAGGGEEADAEATRVGRADEICGFDVDHVGRWRS